MSSFPPKERFITKEQLESWFTPINHHENTSEVRECENDLSITRSETGLFRSYTETS